MKKKKGFYIAVGLMTGLLTYLCITMKKKKGFYIAVGLMTGLLIGVYLDNIGLWLSLGLVFGVSVENSKHSKKTN